MARQEVLEMSPKNNKSKNFVGRESELKELHKLLKKPYGKVRILFLLGGGGIGKTRLVEKMLEKVPNSVLSVGHPLDLSATEHRSIDGIQLRIVEIVETLTSLEGDASPFAEFRKENQDTSEKFNQCLRKFCAQTPLMLAFDTFEMLNTVTSNWLFSEGKDGLQVPGLICIVAGRTEKDGLDNYLNNSLVKKIVVTGLTLLETETFYRDYNTNIISSDFQIWAEQKQEAQVLVPQSLKFIWQITEGHPLRIAMALNWGNLGEINLDGVNSPQSFEEKMMKYVIEWGEKGELYIDDMRVDQKVFSTLACMGILTRRFDERILKYLIQTGHIRDDSKKFSNKEILEPLEKYFFVKIRTGDYGEQVYQLHDEMARLVQKHVWHHQDPSNIRKKNLLRAILNYYEDRISETKNVDLKKILQIEHLYYSFKLDLLSDPIGDMGRQLWLELANLDDDYINTYLPSEINEYKHLFDAQTRYDIHTRVARIEYEAGHITQARKEWELVQLLGRAEKRNDWVAFALFSLASCNRNLSDALSDLQKARRFCEKYAHEHLPQVNYHIGFTYRKMQKVDKAIEWYKKAQKEFKRNSKNKVLGAQISNDLGYAYSHVGKWDESRKNIKEGQKVRKDIKSQLEKDVAALEVRLRLSKRKKIYTDLHDLLTRTQNRLSKARLHLGMSHNTLGEIYRYDEDLDAALRNYDTAYALFEIEKYYKWQAKALFSRGEIYRRIAWSRYRENDEKGYEENITKAEEDIQQSLYLCEKYRINEERDTANRRMGRVLHDRAIHALEEKDRKKAWKLLKLARYYFIEGLKYANSTGDDLEILSNQTELAFLYDDFVRAIGRGKIPQEYRDSLSDLKRTLDEHREKQFRIYQFEVFENEYKLEMAAAAYQNRKYNVSLKKYLEGYVGLAVDPGYGRTRYRSLFPHLAGQIEKLSPEESKKWCQAFIREWETLKIVSGKRVRLDRESIFPDMLQWCWSHLEKI